MENAFEEMRKEGIQTNKRKRRRGKTNDVVVDTLAIAGRNGIAVENKSYHTSFTFIYQPVAVMMTFHHCGNYQCHRRWQVWYRRWQVWYLRWQVLYRRWQAVYRRWQVLYRRWQACIVEAGMVS